MSRTNARGQKQTDKQTNKRGNTELLRRRPSDTDCLPPGGRRCRSWSCGRDGPAGPRVLSPGAARALRPGEGEPLSRGAGPGGRPCCQNSRFTRHPVSPRRPVRINRGLARGDQAVACGPGLRSSEASECTRHLAASEPSCGSLGSEAAARGAGVHAP